MVAIVPSYIAKVSRAEKHLVDLEVAIDAWGGEHANPRPYTVRQRVQSKRQRGTRWELHFTHGVENTDIPLIAADAIYNLRSSLDHLICACVKSEHRNSVMFPIFWEGVWEAAIPGENAQRTKDRARWASLAEKLPDGAVTVLKGLQPKDNAWGEDEGRSNVLLAVNTLSNTDRHKKLPLVAHGLRGMLIVWQHPDGTIQRGWCPPDQDERSFLEDHAEIRGVPARSMYMDGFGAPVVVVRRALDGPYPDIDMDLVKFITHTIRVIRDRIVPDLSPYLWTAKRR